MLLSQSSLSFLTDLKRKNGREGNKEESSIHWFTPHTTALPSLGDWNSSFPGRWQGPNYLVHPLMLFQAHLQGARSEVEQSRRSDMEYWLHKQRLRLLCRQH